MKILIADDEKTLVEMLREILRQNKIDCDVANDGQEAVYFAKESIYDVIVLDVMMPKMNGYEALEEIRRNKINTPVLKIGRAHV